MTFDFALHTIPLLLRTFRYPLHPTVAQETTLGSWLRTCQQLYNAALQHRRDAWEHEKRQRQAATDRGVERKPAPIVTYNSQTAELTSLRSSDEIIASIPVEVERSALRRCDRAFQAFFRRVKAGQKPGYPRFRSLARYDSFEVGRVAPVGAQRGTRSAHVRIPKLGLVRFHEYRPLAGAIRNVTVRREATGRWFICFSCDLGATPPKVPAAEAVQNVVGIDVGLTSLVATSDGETIAAPRFFRKAEDQLAMRQQRLARRRRRGQKSTQGARVAQRLVAKAHAHVRQQRLDFARKLACVLVAKYDVIAVEDLNVKGLAAGVLAKSVTDAAWSTLVHAVACKAESAGKWCVAVDARGTSQRCSRCGIVVPKDLSVREHRCPCGYVVDRDVNAAQNVKALGTSVVLARVGCAAT